MLARPQLPACVSRPASADLQPCVPRCVFTRPPTRSVCPAPSTKSPLAGGGRACLQRARDRQAEARGGSRGLLCRTAPKLAAETLLSRARRLSTAGGGGRGLVCRCRGSGREAAGGRSRAEATVTPRWRPSWISKLPCRSHQSGRGAVPKPLDAPSWISKRRPRRGSLSDASAASTQSPS